MTPDLYDLIDDLNAVFRRYGWQLEPVPNGRSEPLPYSRSERPNPHSNAGQNALPPVPNGRSEHLDPPRSEPPKDYAVNDADAELIRKKNRLAALISRGKV